MAMIVSELFLHRAVETFRMSILLRCPRTSVIVREVEFKNSGTKVLLELAPIVSQYEGERKWKDRLAEGEEVSCCLGRMRGGGKGEAEAGIEVDEGDDIAPCSIDVLFESVESHHMTWIASD